MSAQLIYVALLFIPKRMNVYLRFGRPARERLIDAQRRVAEFAPNAVFCRIRWEANDYGTTLWQLSVLQAAAQGDECQRIAGVIPGATLLLHVDGARKVQPVLRLIDAIEGQEIDPAEVAPSYWRMAHYRLAARDEVGPYTLDRHAAHLLRRRLA
jgi:hypothetical protein